MYLHMGPQKTTHVPSVHLYKLRTTYCVNFELEKKSVYLAWAWLTNPHFTHHLPFKTEFAATILLYFTPYIQFYCTSPLIYKGTSGQHMKWIVGNYTTRLFFSTMQLTNLWLYTHNFLNTNTNLMNKLLLRHL